MQPIPRLSWFESLLLWVGTLSYPLVLAALFWPALSPQYLFWSWGLASEHGELEFEHLSHFAGILLAATPLSLVFARAPGRPYRRLLVVVPLLTSLPYFMQSTWQYAASDSWLSGYAWQLDGLKVVASPALLGAIWLTVVGLKRPRL